MATTQPRKSRKADILTAFTEMVAERGYAEVSLRDIAETVGVSKGTIVHHYGSKERLLEASHARYMTRVLDQANLILQEVEGPPRQLLALVYQMLVSLRDDRAATVAFAREIVRFSSSEDLARVRAMRAEYRGLIRSVVQRGMDEGIFRRDDPDLVTLQVLGMCNWAWTWLRPEGRWSVDQITATFASTLLGGLVAPGAPGVGPPNDPRVLETVLRIVGERRDVAAA